MPFSLTPYQPVPQSRRPRRDFIKLCEYNAHMNTELLTWPADTVCLHAQALDVGSIAADVYSRVCRTNFESPGFCVLNLGASKSSIACRQWMVDLKGAMAAIHHVKTGDTLIYLSAARFDQQTTTKPHLDGGPEECFLMLGYEPTDVEAEIEICDYSKCAFDLGVSPKEFLARHNPMFHAGRELLRPYSTRIPCFSCLDYQIICINNSSASFDHDHPRWQGVLHTATILLPDESKRRVVNSTMIAPAPAEMPDLISAAELQDFITTSSVRRRGYDKPHLDENT